MKNKLATIIKGLVKARVKTRAHFINVKRQLSNQQKMAAPLNSDLLRVYQQLLKRKQIKEDKILARLLRKRGVRTLSGVAVVTVITKSYPCPGKCIYCPGEKGMPKSYLSNEPAIMRAVLTKFDPYRQVTVRLKALENNGHPTDKVELIVLGGSWSAYPKPYQTQFIKRCFDALNAKKAKNLAQAQKWNEKAKHRCVGLTLETRPDMITAKEIKRLRELGCTRVELGVQSLYDPILKLNKRGHTVKQTIEATKLLKEAGLKVMYHLMPNLPGSTPTKDLKMFKELFSKSDFQPDLLKIYPCVVTKDSVLYRWYKQGKYKPYSEKQLRNLLIKIKQTIPYYVRLTRLIRDIPAVSIMAGNKITNLRQLIHNEIQNTSQTCKCIRCREAGHQENSKFKIQNSKLQFKIQKYRANDGTEYFLSLESKDRKVLYAFLRLRINNNINDNFIEELKGAALIRELHTYGQLAPLGQKEKVQHLGLGKKLLTEAEKITKKQGLKKIAIISGIGVREYYKKLGYQLEETYMTKSLK
jgi:elongator complex protein 3